MRATENLIYNLKVGTQTIVMSVLGSGTSPALGVFEEYHKYSAVCNDDFTKYPSCPQALLISYFYAHRNCIKMLKKYTRINWG